MGVKVTAAKKPKPKAAPKKSSAAMKKKLTPKKEPVSKVKPEAKPNDAPKPKAVKSKPAPKKKALKKKSIANNTPAKKEVNDTPTNDVPEKKESRKRAAPKAYDAVPAKQAKNSSASPKKKTGRGRPPSKANNVISPKKKETPKKTPEKPAESAAKATNNVEKKQSKAKPAKKSPAKGRKTAAKAPKKSVTNEKKTEGEAKVTKVKASGGKRAKKSPAAKTKSVFLNPVVELDPFEHLKALQQVPFTCKVKVPRLNIRTIIGQVKMKPIILIPQLRIENLAEGKKVLLNDEEIVPSQNVHNFIDETIVHGTEERNPLNKKYQQSMERIKQLTVDEITQFVNNNRELCQKLRHVKSHTLKNELKDSFKLYPFNSSQQLAMYYALREIFNIPKTKFKECKNFFTVIMPALSSLLFAKTFDVKDSAAPRLIKKLYPNPTSLS